jgi:L-fuconolactonase
MRVDAHLHFWQPACGFDNRPIADNAFYRRDFMPVDVMPELNANGIDGAILVQTAPQTAETDWLLELAADEPRVWGVTAWVDLDGPQCDYPALLARPKVVGIRAQLRRVADAAFVARPDVVANLAAALEAGLNVTVLAEARHYPHLKRVLAQLPPGPVTINHLALPFPDADRTQWRDALHAFVCRTELYMQFSGLPFLFGHRWREAEARSRLDDVLEIFGPRRLLFASDYPMLLRFATYTEWVRAVEAYLDQREVAASDVAAIFAGNALRANPRLRVPDSFASQPRAGHGWKHATPSRQRYRSSRRPR